ncbi:MAG: endolytic transglycosylase MltG [Candidatus Zambryskibacteria bacterium]|nr:endolytic transglycosylase MltG [Candidatus Zambryskibacteria bacterium]
MLWLVEKLRIYLSTITALRRKQAGLFALGFVILILLIWGFIPPRYFPVGSIVDVPEGAGLYSLSLKLKEDGVIRSPFWFRIVSIILRGERDMKAGQYYLSKPESSLTIAWRIFHGDEQIEMVKLTIPEGFTLENISSLFDERFPLFDHAVFEMTAPEGYLFPDTYFVPVTATATSIIKLLQENFSRKISPVMPEVELSGKKIEEIITMASLIEGETNNQLDREMVSSVLWKRIKLDMPLQVDVEMKTYEFQGLPEVPINNPGILSIQAALHPTTTPYLYYLTGKDGKMHYARTFDEHQNNIAKYLH